MGRKTASLEIDEKLNKFIKRREQIKSNLRSFSVFISNFDSQSDLDELSVRLKRAEPLFEQYEQNELEIDLLDESRCDLEKNLEFERQYFVCMTLSKKHLDKQNNVGSNRIEQPLTPCNVPIGGAPSIGAKLPQIGLPKFRGDYDKFSQFLETFFTLIDKNPNLDNIQKLYYLIDALEGEAKKVLDCLEVTNNNYEVAIELLTKRFYNKPLIIQSHLKALFDSPQLQRESHQLIQGLVDVIHKHIRALKTLGEPVESWDRLIIFFISRKLDHDTKKEWEERSLGDYNGSPSLNHFIEFLQNKARILGTVEYNSKPSSRNLPPKSNFGVKGSFAVIDHTKNIRCEYCKGTHYVYSCEKLKGFPINTRLIEVKNARLCTNCLRSSHQSKDCKSSGCRICRAKHHTLLHLDNRPQNPDRSVEGAQSFIEVADRDIQENNIVMTTTSCNQKKLPSQIILSTAVIEVQDNRGQFVKARALLDSGSQVNLVTKDFTKRLGLGSVKVNMPVSGINEVQTRIDSQVNAKIKSVYNKFTASLSFLAIDSVTSYIPSRSFDSSILDIPPNLKLADPNFDKSAQIDILLGASIFYDLLCVGQIRQGRHRPILQKTVFGWIVSGPLYSDLERYSQDYNSNCHLVTQQIQDQLEKFWLLEEFPKTIIRSKEEGECEQHFVQTFSRNEKGRFVVSLPIRDNVNKLGDSLELATHRFLSLERKLAKNPSLKQKYSDFINEYIDLGHMSKISSDEKNKENGVFYLPHHAVLNDNSTTTKLRVVFDASAKSSSGVSLNDVLKVGPTVQDDLFEILIRFRQHEVVVTADIEKMYRQVEIIPEHRDLQRIIWRNNPNETLEHFRLRTVTYGTASASFLATRSLMQIALDIQDQFPKLSSIILKSFYVDDLTLLVDSVDEAIDLSRSLSTILDQYGFPLRKWCSNNLEVAKGLPTTSHDPVGHLFCDNAKKTLGLFWIADKDQLSYTVKVNKETVNKVTKRVILSQVSQIFDPLGLIGPVIIQAKLLLQILWQMKLDWDETIPIELNTRWINFCQQLQSLPEIKIPRMCHFSKLTSLELHGFSDASELAYGASVYLKSVSSNGEVKLSLLCAKSRVAPLKSLTIPRLELCGALLLAQLAHKVLTALDITISSVYYWTDSTKVISWLAQEPSTWSVFVANRVAEIQSLSKNAKWYHVSSGDNPADAISRGVSPAELKDSELWWNGPSWLQCTPDSWPSSSINVESVPERRNKKIVLTGIIQDRTIFELKSTLFQLKKVVAWCFRFVNNSRAKPEHRNFNRKLTVAELDAALISLIKVAQNQEFFNEFNSLKKQVCVSNHSSLKSLVPFLKDGLILVGGRLKNARSPFETKHPIILPRKHTLTKLIILDFHRKYLHAGPQALLAAIRQTFWIIDGRRTIRNILTKCHTCVRVKPISFTQKMGNLPKSRITPQRPFYSCGIDFAGPFNLKDGKLRNRKIVKAYMCLFVCFATKAVHIEVVGDLSSDSFLNCLKRFVSRRGLCKHIYTDNGTNFIGCNNELIKIRDALSKIQNDASFKTYCLDNYIEWHFIPARSPHQGGLWESAIKSAKGHLIRIIGNRSLVFEDLCTIFTQIEAVLNSRPLTPLSSDPNDLQVLTPGHFLIGDPLCALPQRDVMDPPNNRLSHYHQLQQIVQHLWSRWSTEYLATLQQRTKWHGPSVNVQIGSLVLLKEESTHPLNWRIGRIVELHPGPDGLVRVASVRTTGGTVRRAIQKLCALPVENY